MSTDVPIARAVATDEDVLLQLISKFYELENYPFNREKLKHILSPLLVSDQHGVVWKVGSPVSGYAVITWGYSLESGGAEALIDEIYLTNRSQGLGGMLLAHIVDDCRSRGVQRMFLETELRNERVRAFYRRSGFCEDDSIWMSLWLTSPRATRG